MSSTKQKINTRSSIETELVGDDDFILAICWTRFFLKSQGYRVLDNVLFQDNRSSILMEKNGTPLSSNHTKHINIQYFFIIDRVAQGKVSLVWGPNGNMIGDFMTKPLQGALSTKFKDQIMGVILSQYPGPVKSQPGKSHPGKSIQTKARNNFFSLFLLVGQHHRSVLG